MRYLYLSLIFLVIGCANYRAIDMQQKNYLQFKPSNKNNTQYEFVIKNVFDVGFDGDKKEDRESLIYQVLQTECKNGIYIINEKNIVSGKWVTGKPIRTYYSDVNCK